MMRGLLRVLLSRIQSSARTATYVRVRKKEQHHECGTYTYTPTYATSNSTSYRAN